MTNNDTRFDLSTYDGVLGLLTCPTLEDNPYVGDTVKGEAFIAWANATADLVRASAEIDPADKLEFASAVLSVLAEAVEQFRGAGAGVLA